MTQNADYAGTRTRCKHCHSTGGDFIYNGRDLCCECMSEFCSWLLDGGMSENPDQFAYMLQDTHPYTVDVWIVGAEPYPCVICGGWRQDPRHEQVSPDGRSGA